MNNNELLKAFYIRFLFLLPIISHSEDLFLNNQTLILDGAHTYGVISLNNNSFIYVDSTSSKLILYCDSLFVDSTSGIIADNISLNHISIGSDFTDVGAGGAGGGYANLGGNGGGDVESSGGIITGHLDSLSTGSMGGTGDVQLAADDHIGGKGGGAIMIVSYSAEIFGKISANGGSGNDYYTSGGDSTWDHGGSGGGSGGHIILNILHLEMHRGSLISVRGGDGGIPFEGNNEGEPVIPGGGGGGSGGYVTISSLAGISSEYLDIVGGTGGDNPNISCYPGQNGLVGSYNYKHLSIISLSHPDPSVFYLNNVPVFQLAASGQISGYFYEVSDSPENNVTLAQSQAIPSSEEITIYEHGSIDDGTWYLHIIPYSSNGTFQENWAGTYQFRIGRNSIQIDSQTHPDSSEWYPGQTIVLDISALPGISNYHYDFSRNPLIMPQVGISNQLSVNSWIEFASGYGEYFLNIIPEDSVGYVINEPIRKRFNVGSQPPFSNFFQIPSLDTLVLSSTGPYDNFILDWENTQNTSGDSFNYFIEFFLDFETVFPDTVISSSQDSVCYDGAQIYQGMLGVDGDTVSGYWWVHALIGQDTLGSLNGPLPFVIMKEPYPIGSFYLFEPQDSASLLIDHMLIEDTLKFNWGITETENDLPLNYNLTFTDTSGYVNNDTAFFLFQDTVLSETELFFDYYTIYNLMDSLGLDTFALEWQVEAFDSTHSLESINGPQHLELAILSPPIVPFNLGSPANNQNLFLQMDNILDTLEFLWSESFNIFGDSIYYKVLFEDTVGIVNTNGTSLFSDFSLTENTFSISHVDLFRKMDSLNVDSVSVVWQVYALDSIDSVFSVNGPYHLHISKDSVNIDIPSIYLQIEDSLFSRNMDIETKMIHIYEDSLQLTMDFSIDQGESWTNEFKIDTLQNIVDINYSWNVLNEFGWNYIEDLLLRLYAISDNTSSDTLIISNVTIANLVGDYVHMPAEEIGLKANDISILVSSFYDIGEEIADIDIGPSSGDAPLLTINPDGIIDFEDLATFTQMWYWSVNNFLITDSLTNYVINEENIFSMTPLLVDLKRNEEAKSFEINYDREVDFYGFELIIKYNAQEIDYASISISNNSLDANQRTLLMSHHNEEKGSYKVSAWSKKNEPLSFQDLSTRVSVRGKNNNHTIIPIKLYFTPYFSKNDKGPPTVETLELNMANVFPDKIYLSNNYPNPFNPSTKIGFNLITSSFLTIKIFDILGRDIQTLANDYFEPGYKVISWDGKDYAGKAMSAGMYIYQLKTSQVTLSKKMVLLK